MLILAYIFKCMDPMLTIAASFGQKSPFPSGLDNENKLIDFRWGDSDLLPVHKCFKLWQECKGNNGRRAFAKKNKVDNNVLVSIERARKDLVRQFESINLRIDQKQENVMNTSDELASLLSSVLFAAFGNLARVDILASPSEKDRFSSSAPPVARNTAHPDKDVQYMCKEGVVSLFPGSVNYGRGKGVLSPSRPGNKRTQWVTYLEKMKTSRVFLRDTSFVPPAAIALFGNNVNIYHGERCLVVNDWVSLQAAPRTAVLLNVLQESLNGTLERIFLNATGYGRKETNTNKDVVDIEILSLITSLLVDSDMQQ
mmetsp:Transcript_12022/g.13695  ORF Transcript_12022/g.13695 Transcript_12022/m.13695 type:complete len:312 (-) Transcript_12022:839-1774(-)